MTDPNAVNINTGTATGTNTTTNTTNNTRSHPTPNLGSNRPSQVFRSVGFPLMNIDNEEPEEIKEEEDINDDNDLKYNQNTDGTQTPNPVKYNRPIIMDDTNELRQSSENIINVSGITTATPSLANKSSPHINVIIPQSMDDITLGPSDQPKMQPYNSDDTLTSAITQQHRKDTDSKSMPNPRHAHMETLSNVSELKSNMASPRSKGIGQVLDMLRSGNSEQNITAANMTDSKFDLIEDEATPLAEDVNDVIDSMVDEVKENSYYHSITKGTLGSINKEAPDAWNMTPQTSTNATITPGPSIYSTNGSRTHQGSNHANNSNNPEYKYQDEPRMPLNDPGSSMNPPDVTVLKNRFTQGNIKDSETITYQGDRSYKVPMKYSNKPSNFVETLKPGITPSTITPGSSTKDTPMSSKFTMNSSPIPSINEETPQLNHDQGGVSGTQYTSTEYGQPSSKSNTRRPSLVEFSTKIRDKLMRPRNSFSAVSRELDPEEKIEYEYTITDPLYVMLSDGDGLLCLADHLCSEFSMFSDREISFYMFLCSASIIKLYVYIITGLSIFLRLYLYII